MDTTTASSDNNVLVGPDLNDSRPPLDKRLYRQILLPNGLRAVLISDPLVVAMMHHDYYEHDNDDEESSSDESDNDDIEQDSHHDDEDDDSEFEEQEGLREAAAAMVVGVGSMYDPPEAQGMAHFLEHMLFMGTKKYPTENGYDAFLSKQGGSDNACTELEYTVYHFEIPQEGLFQALDMFAQFFIHPLLLEDAVERELNSIESEFQLSKNSDHCRVQQLMCETCGHDAEQHPFAKFSWGNLASLKETPEKNGVCIMDLLRSFYNQYYYASNMRLVVIGAYSLDVLQKHVVDKFSNVPALPREPSPLQPTLIDKDTWDAVYESKMKKCGLPFERATLGKIFRIVPVKDIHSLLLTWQLPSQFSNWRTKPCDYIAHLLGHEAQGSLFSALKAKSWVTGLYAGVGSSGLETASSHALFNVTLSLSREGVAKWRCIVTEMYRYIGMMRYYAASTEGLPEWIHEELKSIHELAYRYGDEVSSEDFVQELAEELAPHMCLPPERLLDGSELLFGYDPEEVKVRLCGS
jgi:nardilysin